MGILSCCIQLLFPINYRSQPGGGMWRRAGLCLKMLPERYPEVKWNISYAAAHGTKDGSLALARDEFGVTDALIRGVVW